MKARSPIEERLVAGMSNKDDVAERRCTSATRVTRQMTITGSSPVDALEH